MEAKHPNEEQGPLGKLLSLPGAILRRAPYHNALFGTKPKNGHEWFQRVQEVFFYLAFLVIASMVIDQEDWRALFESFSN